MVEVIINVNAPCQAPLKVRGLLRGREGIDTSQIVLEHLRTFFGPETTPITDGAVSNPADGSLASLRSITSLGEDYELTALDVVWDD